jgi:fructokinase
VIESPTNPNEIWVCGEVLIDLIPVRDADSNFPKMEIVGGGPANTATALAKLGNKTYFLGGLSTVDNYGKLSKATLENAGVDLSKAHYAPLPTCTADVSLDENGSASYIFTIDGTATFDFQKTWLPITNLPKVLHIGTLVTIIEPGASVLLEWASELSKKIPVILDPNIRPTVISDRNLYQNYVNRWAQISEIIKVSDDDLEWLYPEKLEIDTVKDFLNQKCKLVVVTKGAAGITGYQKIDNQIIKVEVPGVKITPIDTVGAGDTVGAIITQAIAMDVDIYHDSTALNEVLKEAAVAAAITCSRAGADTPTRSEIADALKSGY